MSPADLQLPAFSPMVARPVDPVEVQAATKKARKANDKAKAAKAVKKTARKVDKEISATLRRELARPAKRTRRTRVAPLMMDAVEALSAVNGLARKEVQTMQELIGMLNPLPRPARKRVLDAVAAILSK